MSGGVGIYRWCEYAVCWKAAMNKKDGSDAVIVVILLPNMSSATPQDINQKGKRREREDSN